LRRDDRIEPVGAVHGVLGGHELEDRVVLGSLRGVAVGARGAAVPHLDDVSRDLDPLAVLPAQPVVSGLADPLRGDGVVDVVVRDVVQARLRLVQPLHLRLGRVAVGRTLSRVPGLGESEASRENSSAAKKDSESDPHQVYDDKPTSL
jgi:hypothetical protein